MHTGQLKQDMDDIVDGMSCLDGGGTLMRINQLVATAAKDDSLNGEKVLIVVHKFANLVRLAKNGPKEKADCAEDSE